MDVNKIDPNGVEVKQIGRRIFYELDTGAAILITDNKYGAVVETTPEQDFEIYHVLQKYKPEKVGVIDLEFNQYSNDFAIYDTCYVDINDGHKLKFINLNEPFRPIDPTVVKVQNLEDRAKATEDALLSIMLGGA